MERPTPTQCLIDALERIEGAEDIVIVWRSSDDEIDWSSNNVPLWKVFGLLEIAKQEMAESVKEEDE